MVTEIPRAARARPEDLTDFAKETGKEFKLS